MIDLSRFSLAEWCRLSAEYIVARRNGKIELPPDAPLWQLLRDAADEIERLQALEVLALTALAETRDAVRLAATACPSCGRTWRDVGDDEVESYIRVARAMAAKAAGGEHDNA